MKADTTLHSFCNDKQFESRRLNVVLDGLGFKEESRRREQNLTSAGKKLKLPSANIIIRAWMICM